jgi:hypothetical protein
MGVLLFYHSGLSNSLHSMVKCKKTKEEPHYVFPMDSVDFTSHSIGRSIYFLHKATTAMAPEVIQNVPASA